MAAYPSVRDLHYSFSDRVTKFGPADFVPCSVCGVNGRANPHYFNT